MRARVGEGQHAVASSTSSVALLCFIDAHAASCRAVADHARAGRSRCAAPRETGGVSSNCRPGAGNGSGAIPRSGGALVPSARAGRYAWCVRLPPHSPKPVTAKPAAGRAFGGSPAHLVADFVTIWAGYDNGNRPVRHYDGLRRRLALAGFAAAARAARLIHRLIWNIDHEL
ncbi:hypothetical protein KDW41_27290 [Burkholderia vietnamiensis]|nr:hypothetical protein [Burkholderia vietnamiensis]